MSNVIVIQNDAIVQEIWDSAQKISCRWTDRVSKTVSVRPLTVDMLEAKEGRAVAAADDDAVDVWMDLQLGKWPTLQAIGSAVRIGEQLSLMVGLNDPTGRMDLQVRDCYAHSSPELTDPAAFRVQLTDSDGCVIKTKLLGPFESQSPAKGSQFAGNAIRVASLSAFSFPDNMQVFTSCNVDVCKDGCEPNPCQPALETIKTPTKSIITAVPETVTTSPPKTTSTTSAPLRTTTQTPTTAAVTTIRISTSTGVPRALQPTLPSLEYLPPVSVRTQPPTTTTRAPATTTSAPLSSPPPPVPLTLPSLEYLPPISSVKTEAPLNCVTGSKDPRCPAAKSIPLPTSTLEPPPAPTRAPASSDCYLGTDKPECRTPKQVTPSAELKQSLCNPADRECVVAGGSNESPVTSPSVGEDPENGAAKEGWKGDPSTHAFHMFHFQRGDGRRGSRKTNTTASTRTRRTVTSEFAHVRLTRSVRVLPALQHDQQPESISANFQFDEQKPPISDQFDDSDNSGTNVCLSTSSFLVSASLVVATLIGFAILVVFLSIKYIGVRRQLAKFLSPRC